MMVNSIHGRIKYTILVLVYLAVLLFSIYFAYRAWKLPFTPTVLIL